MYLALLLTLTTILLSHLFQHVVQSLCLQVYNKRLFLPAVQVFEKLPVTGIIKFLDTYGADLPTILACLFHDSLQYRIPYDKKSDSEAFDQHVYQTTEGLNHWVAALIYSERMWFVALSVSHSCTSAVLSHLQLQACERSHDADRRALIPTSRPSMQTHFRSQSPQSLQSQKASTVHR